MSKILVCGLTNVETSLNIEEFPVNYSSVNFVFDKTGTKVSGVGVNIAKALKTLGSDIEYLSVVGEDLLGKICKEYLTENSISTEHIYEYSHETAQSIILYDKTGKRSIFVDPKKVQEVIFPIEIFEKTYKDCDILILSNVNFTRPFLFKKLENQIIACDVHAISSIDDDYNQDYMKNADILFFSNDNIHEDERAFMEKVYKKFNNSIIVCGLGADGALVWDEKNKKITHYNVVTTREIVNTIGAGDSLFSSFLHFYNKTGDADISIRKAMYFASWKIGEKNASEGFLTENQLNEIMEKY